MTKKHIRLVLALTVLMPVWITLSVGGYLLWCIPTMMGLCMLPCHVLKYFVADLTKEQKQETVEDMVISIGMIFSAIVGPFLMAKQFVDECKIG